MTTPSGESVEPRRAETPGSTTPSAKSLVDLWHRPRRGPGGWDWRCLDCSMPVNVHPNVRQRLVRKLSRWRS